jgi:hypothetical protein
VTIELYGTQYKLEVGDDWQRLKTMPEDPVGACCIGRQTDASSNMVLISPIERSMPFDNSQAVIDGIHESLAEDQGLIEVEAGKGKSSYIYSIVKSVEEDKGVQYCLTFHFCIGGKLYQAQGFFSERGTTGIRDAAIYEQKMRDGSIGQDSEGWMQDPYDKNYKQGIPMNLSEIREYDALFQNHPLSEARRFVAGLIQQLKEFK